MRTTRGVIASLGASLSLVLAGTMALATISTIVTFQGWPGVSTPTNSTDAAVVAEVPKLDRETQRHRTAVALPAPVHRAPRAEHHAATVSTPPAPARAKAAPQTSSSAGRTSSPGVTGQTSVANETQAPSTTPAKPAPTTQAGEDARNVGKQLGNSVDQTTSNLGQAVQPVSPALGKTLDDAGQALGDTLTNVSQDVGAILDGLRPGK